MSMKNKIKNFFYLDEEEVEVEAQATSQAKQPIQQKPSPQHVQQQMRSKVKERKFATNEIASQNNVVSLQAATSLKGSKVILVEPRVYAEAQDIAEHIKNKRATIVNLQRIDREQGIRIIDFFKISIYTNFHRY